MSEDFLVFLKRRREEILRELAELAAAERLYLKSRSQQPERRVRFTELFEAVTDQDERKPTIKELVLKILESSEHGLTALQILAEMNAKYGTSFDRTSLSPQLSRLKQERRIFNKHGVWKLEEQSASPADQADKAL